jgi:hypothetical protein
MFCFKKRFLRRRKMEYKKSSEACKDPNYRGISKEEVSLSLVGNNIGSAYELVNELEELRTEILDRNLGQEEINSQFKISNFLFLARDELKRRKK